MSFTLFPDQEVFVANLRAALTRNRRVLGVAPTGFGKTVVFSYMVARARERGRRIGIFAHRAELLEQISNALREFKVPHGIIAKGCKSVDLRHTVHVISSQTYCRRLSKMPQLDLLIPDEAHHATPGSSLDKCLAHSPNGRIVGVTATPERLDGQGLLPSFEEMVLGPYPRELIDAGRLSDYMLYAPPGGIDTSNMGTRAGDWKREDAEGEADKPSITGNAIDHYRKHLNGSPSAAFCVSVNHAVHVAEQFRDAGYIAAHIDGGMETGLRRQIVRDFRAGKINMLTSADILSEGFDVPGMHGALLLRPTKSLAMYLQQVGRALRVCPGKSHAVILDHANNSADSAHGLPCLERDWSLEGRKKGKPPVDGSMTWECPKCFSRWSLSVSTCKDKTCKTERPSRPRVVEEVAGELVEVDKEAVRKIISPAKIEQGQAKTLRELEELAERRGYAKGWALHIFNARQAKRARV